MREETNVIEMLYGNEEMKCNAYVTNDELILLPTYMHEYFAKLVDLVVENEKLRSEFLGCESHVENYTFSYIMYLIIYEAILDYEDKVKRLKTLLNSKQE